MDKSAFDAAQPFLDQIADAIDEAFESPALAKLREALAGLSKAVGEQYPVEFEFTVGIYHERKIPRLPLLSSGLFLIQGEEPERVSIDASAQRYIVDGELQVVPHDRCPKCWAVWDFKWENHLCPRCDATLGENCKILLDADICPNCDDGKVSMHALTCDKCGYTVDPKLVVWG